MNENINCTLICEAVIKWPFCHILGHSAPSGDFGTLGKSQSPPIWLFV